MTLERLLNSQWMKSDFKKKIMNINLGLPTTEHVYNCMYENNTIQ